MQKSSFHRYIRRETNAGYSRQFQRESYINSHLLQHLELDCILEGHTGCVNCLEWNEEGTILASGSDDRKIMLWDPHRKRNIHSVDTQHHSNIFSVKFMPYSADHVVVSGAADGCLYLHDLVAKETIHGYDVKERIKKLATTKAEPNTVFCASEDGAVREFDTRQSSSTKANILVNLSELAWRGAECKSIAINPTNPNLFVVGANDPYVRLYDRRKLEMDGFVTYFTAGHLRSMCGGRREAMGTYSVTDVNFHSKGSEVLANIGGDHVYIFDLYNKTEALSLTSKENHFSNDGKKQLSDVDSLEHTPKRHKSCCVDIIDCNKPSTSGCSHETSDNAMKERVGKKLPISWRESWVKGDALYDGKRYSSAVASYNTAISLYPHHDLYRNRAAALVKRRWNGDLYAAVRDCYSALHLNPLDVKARFRLVRCMYELECFEQAWLCMKEFKHCHPSHSSSDACVALQKEIRSKLKQKASSDKKSNMTRVGLLPKELEHRATSFDYMYRYCGHCNTTTDIKEASYIGEEGKYIVAGSDEGSFFIWERETTNLVRVMRGDSAVVNCIQPHPSVLMLATSGIDPEIKVWSPRINTDNQENVVKNIDKAVEENHKLMNASPLDSMFMTIGFPTEDEDDYRLRSIPCRTT